jgi:hypothetical protein
MSSDDKVVLMEHLCIDQWFLEHGYRLCPTQETAIESD